MLNRHALAACMRLQVNEVPRSGATVIFTQDFDVSAGKYFSSLHGLIPDDRISSLHSDAAWSVTSSERSGKNNPSMHLEVHAMLGWTIGNFAGKDTRLRRYCTVGAVLPDIDGLGFFLSPTAYDHYHHTFGHNLFITALFALLVGLHCRSWKALGLGALSFGSHLLTDAGLSGWPVFLWWPLSGRAYLLPHALPLAHPLNIQLMYVGCALVLALAVICKRTPIELLSPRLDRLVVSIFSTRPLACHQCGRRANLTCAACGKPVCLRHASVRRNLELLCGACGKEGNARPEAP